MNKKSITKLAFTLFSLSLVLSACGAGGNTPDSSPKSDNNVQVKAKENVKLTFWDENAGPDRTPYLKELINRFQEKNPTITVEYVGIPNASNKQKYDVAISSDETPDIGGVNAVWISDFAAKGALLPLDSFLDKWNDKNKIDKKLIEYNKSLAPDKKLYQIPTTMYMDVFWYRTDWIKEAGLNPPTTWDSFFADAEKLKDSSKNRYGYSIRGGDGSINQLTTAMFAYSGIGNYFKSDGKSTINDPKNIEFLKKYASLYKNFTPTSDITNAYKEMVGTFDTGTSAMIQHNFGSYNNHLQAIGEGKFAATILPKSDNGKRVIAPTANGYGIFKNTKHPDEAWLLLSFLLSNESQTYWNEKIGQMPTNTDSLQSDYVKKVQHIQEGAQVLADKDTIVLDVPLNLPDYSNILKQILEPNFQKVLAGTMTPENFLNSWASAIEKAKADYDKSMKK
ncbi:extracellular solute-binding protein [Paenibacillus sp. LMG 31456]|uniref:Extracellular solute-binding protein n=1 Tax=Paenibacillus foliorum TaxID=2654974 RepID=A0A972H0V2_9BACL|nr:sugar ABC transporter substrate-binding protein [Paenibacillus foliorum]NOU97382.1 extracellular solute-binding protein [Paenibacillus foliorum]